MKSLPEQEAQDILARVRAGADVETLLSHVANGDLLLQLSVVPETRYRYELPYMPKLPASLLTTDNPYLRSCIYDATGVFSATDLSRASSHAASSSKSKAASHLHRPESATYDSIYLKPFHAAEVIDPKISQLKISSWTTVCDDNVLMRHLLQGLLQCEYHFTAAFQKDLFLEDMIAQREEFCSSLLVNIMLAYSCVRRTLRGVSRYMSNFGLGLLSAL